jgi:hypothetical protein
VASSSQHPGQINTYIIHTPSDLPSNFGFTITSIFETLWAFFMRLGWVLMITCGLLSDSGQQIVKFDCGDYFA